MNLLSFTVRNHGSIRDEITLDLARPTLRTLHPKDSAWADASYPMAGIFGGNATGKSAILDALAYFFAAIRDSSTTWQARPFMSRVPFQLDEASRTGSSSYEIDFVHAERRHRYGFEVDAEGIQREWLLDVPTSRWRTLLTRDRNHPKTLFHGCLKGRIDVTPRELILSRGRLMGNAQLSAIAEDLVGHFDTVLVKDSHREARLRSIADSLAEHTITFGDLEALLHVADIGILHVGIEETNIPPAFRRALAELRRTLQTGDAGEPSEQEEKSTPNAALEAESDGLDSEERDQVIRNLIFTHRGSAADCPPFSILEESDGTIAWLATAVPALETLRSGGLLLVDEIDASLHPHLLEVLLRAFADPEVNRNHAQLIFTTHESHVLSPLSEVRLDPEQVWLTDKTYEGVTELACMADFPKHPDANVARRYLLGRYGGTPRLSPSLFASLIGAEED